MNRHDRFNSLLSTGRIVEVYLDPRYESVLLPERYTKKAVLLLHIGLNIFAPVHNLDVGPKGIAASLRFDGKYETCFLTWEAIYAMCLEGDRQNGWVWKPFPPEEKQEEKPVVKTKPRGHLKLVVNNG